MRLTVIYRLAISFDISLRKLIYFILCGKHDKAEINNKQLHYKELAGNIFS
jgi:hypothetical protein